MLEARRLLVLLLLLLLLPLPMDSRGSRAEAHTLRYDLAALSQDGSGKTQLLAQGYLDDELFLRYDEKSQTAEPLGLRDKGHAGAETWREETEGLKEKGQQLSKTLTEFVAQKGPEGGLHTLQATLGCELQGNHSTAGFWCLGYNGQDFLSFDPGSLTWKATLPSAQQTKRFWEMHGPSASQVKNFLYELCPVRLQRYLASSGNIPVNTGSPMVTVTHKKNPTGSVTLKCWAFNLNSRGATLTWLRDGDPVYLGTFGPGVTLPSGDGTHQTWMATRVLPGEEQSFTCLLRQQGENTTTPVFGSPAWKTDEATIAASPLPLVTLCSLLVALTSA